MRISLEEASFIAQRSDSEVLGDDAVLLGEPVDAVVGLSHAADGAADGVRLPRAGHPAEDKNHHSLTDNSSHDPTG